MKRRPLFFSPLTITDDRGERRELQSLQGLAQWQTGKDERLRLLAERIQLALLHNTRAQLLVFVLIGLSFPVFLGLLAPVATFLNLKPANLLIPIGVLWGLGAGIPMRRRMQRRAAGIAAMLVEEGLCAACGYNLYNIPLSNDTCTVCPECGSAWKTSRIKRAEPIDDAIQSQYSPETFVKSVFAGVTGQAYGPTTHDARGRVVGVARARLSRERKRPRDAVHSARLAMARRELMRIGRPFRVAVALFFLVMSMLMVSVSFVAPGALPFLMVVFPLWLAAGVYFGPFAYSSDKMVAILRRWGLCPSCAWPLADEPSADDRTIECERCHSAWPVMRMEARN